MRESEEVISPAERDGAKALMSSKQVRLLRGGLLLLQNCDNVGLVFLAMVAIMILRDLPGR